MASGPPKVFISYSHKDKQWCDDLHTHLKPYLREGSIISWSDAQISPGSKWINEIKSALIDTKVAVLLVSPDYIASDFIHEYELGPLLKEAKQGRLFRARPPSLGPAPFSPFWRIVANGRYMLHFKPNSKDVDRKPVSPRR